MRDRTEPAPRTMCAAIPAGNGRDYVVERLERDGRLRPRCLIDITVKGPRRSESRGDLAGLDSITVGRCAVASNRTVAGSAEQIPNVTGRAGEVSTATQSSVDDSLNPK